MPYFGIPIRNGLPIGLGSVAGFGAFQFSPSVLFAAGEQGAWYDPSDLTTLFQDAAGTTPTTMETRARLMQDKSGRGNHAVAPSDASSPILRARYNLLTYSEDFSNAAWTKSDATVSANTTTAPDGTTTADKLIEAATTAQHLIYATVTLANTPNTFSIAAKAAERSIVYVWLQDSVRIGAYFDLSSGTVTTTDSGITSTITDLGNGWYRCRITRATITAGTCFSGATLVSTGTTTSYTGDGTSGVLLWGADLRTSSDAALNIPAYQSITTATSYDTAGFPPYLAFDGTDDSFSTASIDFTGTDKMTVFAGVTKLSDALAGCVAELSANFSTNSGTFIFTAPDGGGQNYGIAARGTSTAFASLQTFAAPISNVVIEQYDIGASIITDELMARVNGAVVSLTGPSGTAGTGNFGNYPLFIGRRNNTSLPFNGRIYSLIIRGASTTTPLIASTESWVAGKMRLPI